MPHEILLREGLEALRGGCLNGVVVSCSCLALQKPLAEKRKARESARSTRRVCVGFTSLLSFLFAGSTRTVVQGLSPTPRLCTKNALPFSAHDFCSTRSNPHTIPSQTTNVKSPPTTPTPQLVLKPLYRDTHDRVGTQHVLELDQRYVHCPPVLLAGVVSLPSFLPAACAT